MCYYTMVPGAASKPSKANAFLQLSTGDVWGKPASLLTPASKYLRPTTPRSKNRQILVQLQRSASGRWLPKIISLHLQTDLAYHSGRRTQQDKNRISAPGDSQGCVSIETPANGMPKIPGQVLQHGSKPKNEAQAYEFPDNVVPYSIWQAYTGTRCQPTSSLVDARVCSHTPER